MFLDFFGRLMFPRLPPWQQRRQIINLIATVSVALVVAGIVVILMLLVYAKK